MAIILSQHAISQEFAQTGGLSLRDTDFRVTQNDAPSCYLTKGEPACFVVVPHIALKALVKRGADIGTAFDNAVLYGAYPIDAVQDRSWIEKGYVTEEGVFRQWHEAQIDAEERNKKVARSCGEILRGLLRRGMVLHDLVRKPLAARYKDLEISQLATTRA